MSRPAHKAAEAAKTADEEDDSRRQQQQLGASKRPEGEQPGPEFSTSKRNEKSIKSKIVDQQQHEQQDENRPPAKMSSSKRAREDAKQQEQAKQLAASLRSAANEGKVELVRLLLKCGADVNAQDPEFGNTALHQAAWNGFSETVQVLCKHRANTSIRNKALFTPLHLACQQGHNQSARLLLMANAQAELRNSYGDTPLHTAARYGHAGVARILLSARCNPNQVNKNNDTPLHIAAAMGRRKLTKIFMQNGAEPMIKNKQDETAMDIALRKDLIEIQELIANPPPKSTSWRHEKHRHDRNHQHAHQHSHNHRRQHRSSGGHRHAGNHLRSASNLIVLDDGGAAARQQHHKRQLSISSGQQQGACKAQLLCSQLYASSSSRLLGSASAAGLHAEAHRAGEDPLGDNNQTTVRKLQALLPGLEQRRRLLHMRAGSQEMGRRGNRLILGDEQERASSSVSNRTPVDAFDLRSGRLPSSNVINDDDDEEQAGRGPSRRRQSKTLRAGLGVSSAALDELLRGRPGRTPTPTNGAATERPRPSSAGSVRPLAAGSGHEAPVRRRLLRRRQQQHHHKQVALDETADRDAPRLGKFRRLRSSPTASVRSSQVGKLRNGAKRLAVGPRRLTLAGGQSVALDQLDGGAAQQPVELGQTRKSSASTSHIGAGRSSLLQLRQMVQRRKAALKAKNQSANKNQSSQAEGPPPSMPQVPEEEGPTTGGCEQQSKPTPVGGRRQERARLQEVQAADQANRCQMRAPNGTKLLKTRPLAPLNDDTQLYAIPRKSGPKAKQQVANGNEAAERPAEGAGATSQRGVDAQAAPPPPTSSRPSKTGVALQQTKGQLREEPPATPNGAALTASDSGHSLASASNSPASCSGAGGGADLAASEPPGRVAGGKLHDICCSSSSSSGSSSSSSGANDQMASSSDEFIESLSCPRRRPAQTEDTKARLVVEPDPDQDPDDDRDLAAPGYSVVRARPQEAQACRCPAASPAGLLTLSACGHQPEVGPKLIEPKSPLSGANAELIAAQKSLAAAAAAKVHRDRLAKLARSKGDGQSPEHHQSQLTVRTSPASGAHALWLHQQHQTLVAAAATRAQQQQQGGPAAAVEPALKKQPAPATGTQKQQQQQQQPQQTATGAHRSGTNSVGMSDSSPSNNGADSDNSLQTTSGVGGSLNTDNASQLTSEGTGTGKGEQHASPTRTLSEPAKPAAKRESSGPFGILSRILLNNNNNKSSAAAASQQQQQVAARAKGGPVGSSPPANRKQQSPPAAKIGFNGSLSSSSALSSPSISTNGRSPNSSSADSTTTNTNTHSSLAAAAVAVGAPHLPDEQQQQQQQQAAVGKQHLDQLGSRSRRPIVLSQSNELPPAERDPAPGPPRLPAKGVLKSSAGGVRPTALEMEQRENLHEIYGGNPHEPNALVNGLPRVASYTQISSASFASRQAAAELCNYHALNRSHMIQAKYSPYLPYALGRYSIHETCDPSSNGLRPAGAYHMAHYPPASVSTANATYGTSATPYGNHSNNNGNDNAPRGNATNAEEDSLREASMVCHYSHDDSIYIPPFALNDPQAGQVGAGGDPFACAPAPGDYHNSQVHAGQRPAGGAHHFGSSRGNLNLGNNNHEQTMAALYDPLGRHIVHPQHPFIDYHHQAPGGNHNQVGRQVQAQRPKSSLGTLCGGGGGGGRAELQQQQAYNYGQRLSARNEGSPSINMTMAAAAKSSYGVSPQAARSQSQLAVDLGDHAAQHRVGLVSPATGGLASSNGGAMDMDQSSQQNHTLVTTAANTTHTNSIYASHLAHQPNYNHHPNHHHHHHHHHAKSELTVLPATTTTIPISTPIQNMDEQQTGSGTRPMANGWTPVASGATKTTSVAASIGTTTGYKSLVQLNRQLYSNGQPQHNGTESNNGKTTTNAPIATNRVCSTTPPPTLPPKTMTTIGKLTRVSIKPRDWHRNGADDERYRDRSTQFNIDLDHEDDGAHDEDHDDEDQYTGATVL